MKPMKKIFSIVSLLLMLPGIGWAQSWTEKITKEMTFEKKSATNAVMIANINGDVKVIGYDGDKVLVEVEKSIFAKTNERLEKGKAELQLGIIDRADTLIFYVEGLCSRFGKTDRRHRGNDNQGWGYDWQDCGRNCRTEYDYSMKFTVKVPSGVSLSVSTVNDGDVTVENVKGSVNANNVNGSIKLTQLMGKTTASTINGDVDLDYVQNPKADCRYYSLNGDINALFKRGLAASVSFESFNGAFYTNVDQLESMPVKLEKSETGRGLKYKVNGNRYKVGAGGVNLDFETFNGDVYLKEF